VIGFAPDHRDIRHWKVDRIDDAEVTQVRFNRPEEFDLQEHLARSFGVFHGDGAIHVKVRFAPTVARYVSESFWHSSQRLTPQKDGSLIADFELGHTEEIKRWIQSFGRHAVVLAPDQLRAEIVNELEMLRRAYASGPESTQEGGPSASVDRSATAQHATRSRQRTGRPR